MRGGALTAGGEGVGGLNPAEESLWEAGRPRPKGSDSSEGAGAGARTRLSACAQYLTSCMWEGLVCFPRA